MTAQDVIEAVGRRIARDLAEQAARTGPDAAREAGCRTDAEVDEWMSVCRLRPEGPRAA